MRAAKRMTELRHESKPDRLPMAALLALASLPPEQSLPRGAEELLDACVDNWAALPAPYMLRARIRGRTGPTRNSLLDCERATRILRAELSRDPRDETSLARLAAHLADHVRHCQAIGEPQERRALATMLAQLREVYPGDERLEKLQVE